MDVQLEQIRARVDCDFLGGPKLAPGSTETCIFVEPRLRVWDLRPHVIRTRSVPKFTGVLATVPFRAPPGGPKPRWKPWRNRTREMLRAFARMIQDGVKDLPYEVRVRTKQGYPGVKTIEPGAACSWSAHVAWVAVKAARAASDSAVIEATGAAVEYKAAKTQRRKRKRANKAFLKKFRR